MNLATVRSKNPNFIWIPLLVASTQSKNGKKNGKSPEKKGSGDLLLAKKQILVVEDSLDIQELISYFLSEHGATVELADDGLQCLEKARKTKFDAILMDIHLPNMDGIEATRELRKEGHPMPIIALTGAMGRTKQDAYFKAGGTHCIEKPINFEKLLALLRTSG